MRNKNHRFLLVGVLVCFALSYLLNRKISSQYERPVTLKFVKLDLNKNAAQPTKPSLRSFPKTASAKLTEKNFDEMVDGCLDELVCHIEGDPLAMYESFKKDSRLPSAKHLIEFMRLKSNDPEYREAYKAPLTNIIEDFNKQQAKLNTTKKL